MVVDSPSPREVVREAVAEPRAAKDEPRENPPPAVVEFPELGGAELDSAVCFLLFADDEEPATPESVRCMALFIMGPCLLRSPPLPAAPPVLPSPFAICCFSGLAPCPTASILSLVLATAVVAAVLAVLIPRPTLAPKPPKAPPILPNPLETFSDGVSGAPLRVGEGAGGVSGGGAKE